MFFFSIPHSLGAQQAAEKAFIGAKCAESNASGAEASADSTSFAAARKAHLILLPYVWAKTLARRLTLPRCSSGASGIFRRNSGVQATYGLT